MGRYSNRVESEAIRARLTPFSPFTMRINGSESTATAATLTYHICFTYNDSHYAPNPRLPRPLLRCRVCPDPDGYRGVQRILLQIGRAEEHTSELQSLRHLVC